MSHETFHYPVYKGECLKMLLGNTQDAQSIGSAISAILAFSDAARAAETEFKKQDVQSKKYASFEEALHSHVQKVSKDYSSLSLLEPLDSSENNDTSSFFSCDLLSIFTQSISMYFCQYLPKVSQRILVSRCSKDMLHI